MIIWTIGKLSPRRVEALTDEFLEISDELNVVRHALMSQTIEFPSRNIGAAARKWSTLMEKYRVKDREHRKVLMGLRSTFPVRDTEARHLEKARTKAASEVRLIQEAILLHDPGVNQAIHEIAGKTKPEEEARNAILISGEPAWEMGNHPVAIIVKLRTDGHLLQAINEEIRIDKHKRLAKLLFVRMLNPAEKIENLYFMAGNYTNDLMQQTFRPPWSGKSAEKDERSTA